MRKLFPLLFLAGGIALALYGFQLISDARSSPAWPTVSGEVIQSSIRETTKRGFPKENLRRVQYRPRITYRYEVDGKSFQSERISFGEGPFNTKGPALDIQSRYPLGEVVSVFYQPGAPQTSVLEPGTNLQTWLIPGIGGALFVFGIMILIGSHGKK